MSWRKMFFFFILDTESSFKWLKQTKNEEKTLFQSQLQLKTNNFDFAIYIN